MEECNTQSNKRFKSTYEVWNVTTEAVIMIYDIEKLKYKKSTSSENEPAIKEFYECNSSSKKRTKSILFHQSGMNSHYIKICFRKR